MSGSKLQEEEVQFRIITQFRLKEKGEALGKEERYASFPDGLTRSVSLPIFENYAFDSDVERLYFD